MKLAILIIKEEYEEKISQIFDIKELSSFFVANTGEFLQFGEKVFLLHLSETVFQQLYQKLEHYKNVDPTIKDAIRIYFMKGAFIPIS